MNLTSVKIFVCVIVVLTLCQCIQSDFIKRICKRSKKLHLQSHNNCTHKNKYDNQGVASGVYAKLGLFPYIVVILRLKNNKHIEQCSGTILSKRWVLTSAYCAENYPRTFIVAFGTINKFNIKNDHLQHSAGISMITTKAFVHPEYSGTINDIALLYMPHNIPFCRTIQPIPLVPYIYPDKTFVDNEARIIGWGRDEVTGESTMNLKYTNIPIISNNECKQYWHITKKHICTAPGLGKDGCQTDSGSPLVVVQKGQEVQIGIASYVDGFCPSKSPAVFTRISSLTKWIHEVMNIV